MLDHDNSAGGELVTALSTLTGRQHWISSVVCWVRFFWLPDSFATIDFNRIFSRNRNGFVTDFGLKVNRDEILQFGL